MKYIVEVEKNLTITGFKPIPVFYYSLTGNDLHDHKCYFQRVFYLDLTMKVEIDWLSDRMQFITKRISNRDPVHLDHFVLVIIPEVLLSCMQNLNI